MRKPVWIWSFLLAVACVATVAAASTTEVARPATAKPVLRFASATSVTNLNPAIDIDSYVLGLAYQAVIHMNPNGSLAPGLATSWGYVGKGNKTFQFTLRQNAKFSDGTPVNAQAVKKWMIYFSGEKGAFAKNIPFETIQTVGDWKVILHLSRAEPRIPFLLSEPFESGYIGSPKALANPDNLKTHTDGSGMYMVDPSKTVPGDHYTFVPNPNYYDQSAIKFSEVVYRTISQPTTLLAAVQTGQIDAGFGDISTVDKAKSAGLDVVTAPLGWAGMLFLDRGATTQDGQPNPLAKLQVRQALNYAVDRNAIAKSLIGQYGKPISQAPTLDGWNPKYANYYPYNPTKAKQLLAAAGYPDGFTLKTLSQTFFGTLGDPLTQAIGKYFAAVGVKLDITPGPTLSDWLPKYLGPDFQAAGFIEGPVISAYSTYSNWYGPKAYVKHHGWDDPVLDKLWATGSASVSPDVYAKQIMGRLTSQADELIVSTTNSFWYVSNHLGGVAYSAVSGYPYPTEWFPK